MVSPSGLKLIDATAVLPMDDGNRHLAVTDKMALSVLSISAQ